MSNDKETPRNEPVPFERFFEKKSSPRYKSKREYLEAIGAQITPDLWSAIVVRSVQDAVFGKPNERAKAREWLGRHLLPDRTEEMIDRTEKLRKDSMSEILVSLFQCLKDAYTPFGPNREDKKKAAFTALSLTLAHLSDQERVILADALTESQSREVKEWREEGRKTIESAEQKKKNARMP